MSSTLPLSYTFAAASLTTVFTPPSSCQLESLPTWSLDILFTPVNKSDLTNYNVKPSMSNDCVPSGYDTKTLTSTPSFSPGVCPQDYTAAASLGAGDTFTSWCCPKGMTWTSNIWHLVQCYSSWTQSGFEISTTATRSNGSSTEATYLLMNQGTETGLLMAEFTPLIVTWASSDLAQFTPASAPLRFEAAAPVTSASRLDVGTGIGPLSTSSTGNAQSSPSSSLSTGTKAGIGVAVAVAALSITALLAWFLLRRRRRSKDASTKETFSKAELHGDAVERQRHGREATELDEDGHVHEMGAASKVAEVGYDEVHELPTDFEGHEVRGDARRSYIGSSEEKT